MAKYVLIQSAGALKVEPRSGDGAYADWMSKYFTQNAATDCVHFARLEFPGGNKVNKAAMTTQFKKDLETQLALVNMAADELEDSSTDAMEVDMPNLPAATDPNA